MIVQDCQTNKKINQNTQNVIFPAQYLIPHFKIYILEYLLQQIVNSSLAKIITILRKPVKKISFYRKDKIKTEYRDEDLTINFTSRPFLTKESQFDISSIYSSRIRLGQKYGNELKVNPYPRYQNEYSQSKSFYSFDKDDYLNLSNNFSNAQKQIFSKQKKTSQKHLGKLEKTKEKVVEKAYRQSKGIQTQCQNSQSKNKMVLSLKIASCKMLAFWMKDAKRRRLSDLMNKLTKLKTTLNSSKSTKSVRNKPSQQLIEELESKNEDIFQLEEDLIIKNREIQHLVNRLQQSQKNIQNLQKMGIFLKLNVYFKSLLRHSFHHIQASTSLEEFNPRQNQSDVQNRPVLYFQPRKQQQFTIFYKSDEPFLSQRVISGYHHTTTTNVNKSDLGLNISEHKYIVSCEESLQTYRSHQTEQTTKSS